MSHITADEARRLADDILESDAWFRRLPAANKDMLSQPNHDANQADKAVALARRVTDLAAEVERLSADNERLREALAVDSDLHRAVSLLGHAARVDPVLMDAARKVERFVHVAASLADEGGE